MINAPHKVAPPPYKPLPVRSLFCKVCGELVLKMYPASPYKIVQEVPCMRCQYTKAKEEYEKSKQSIAYFGKKAAKALK